MGAGYVIGSFKLGVLTRVDIRAPEVVGLDHICNRGPHQSGGEALQEIMKPDIAAKSGAFKCTAVWPYME